MNAQIRDTKDRTDRRTSLLEAALRLIERDGLRALTHRAVESEAGVPHGSTTYHFGTRYDLIAAVIEHMHDLDRRNTEPIAHQLTLMLADRSRELDLEAVIDAAIDWVESNPQLQLARYELQLAGARDPELKRMMTECSATFRRIIEPIVVAAGSKRPQHHAQMVQAMLDGLLMARLTLNGMERAVITEGVRRVLESFLNDPDADADDATAAGKSGR